MNKIYTDIKQSKKLLELGLNSDNADIYITNNVGLSGKVDGTNIIVVLKEYLNPLADCPEIIPSWSLTTLLDLLPPIIKIEGESGVFEYSIDIRKYKFNENSIKYQIAYGNQSYKNSWHDMISSPECQSLLDAAYSMMCWLLENNHIDIKKKSDCDDIELT